MNGHTTEIRQYRAGAYLWSRFVAHCDVCGELPRTVGLTTVRPFLAGWHHSRVVYGPHTPGWDDMPPGSRDRIWAGIQTHLNDKDQT